MVQRVALFFSFGSGAGTRGNDRQIDRPRGGLDGVAANKLQGSEEGKSSNSPTRESICCRRLTPQCSLTVGSCLDSSTRRTTEAGPNAEVKEGCRLIHM